jgi:hypothetical protein
MLPDPWMSIYICVWMGWINQEINEQSLIKYDDDDDDSLFYIHFLERYLLV